MIELMIIYGGVASLVALPVLFMLFGEKERGDNVSCDSVPRIINLSGSIRPEREAQDGGEGGVEEHLSLQGNALHIRRGQPGRHLVVRMDRAEREIYEGEYQSGRPLDKTP